MIPTMADAMRKFPHFQTVSDGTRNGKKCACAAVIHTVYRGDIIDEKKISLRLPHCTSLEAELAGIYLGLENVPSWQTVLVRTDIDGIVGLLSNRKKVSYADKVSGIAQLIRQRMFQMNAVKFEYVGRGRHCVAYQWCHRAAADARKRRLPPSAQCPHKLIWNTITKHRSRLKES